MTLAPTLIVDTVRAAGWNIDTLARLYGDLRRNPGAEILPPAPAVATATGSAPADPQQQIRQLMQDAGYAGGGPPSPAVRAKIEALAKERGIDLSALRGGRQRGGG